MLGIDVNKFDHGEVCSGVKCHNVSPIFTSVEEFDGYEICSLNYVVVGDDMTVFIPNESRTRPDSLSATSDNEHDRLNSVFIEICKVLFLSSDDFSRS